MLRLKASFSLDSQTRMDTYICTLMQDGLDNVLAHFDNDEIQTMDGMLFVKFIIKTVKLNEVV